MIKSLLIAIFQNNVNKVLDKLYNVLWVQSYENQNKSQSASLEQKSKLVLHSFKLLICLKLGNKHVKSDLSELDITKSILCLRNVSKRSSLMSFSKENWNNNSVSYQAYNDNLNQKDSKISSVMSDHMNLKSSFSQELHHKTYEISSIKSSQSIK